MSEVVGVVGGGIVGLAVAREVLRRRPGTQVVVLEREDRLAAHQTGHNSGVVHAGLYYKPGSLKAELCARGRALVRDYCAEHGLAYDECGKLVVAVDRDELGRFDALERTARANGVPGLRRLDGRQIAEVEPHATGLAALHSPHTAITDFPAIARSFGAEVEAAGGRVLLSAEVTGVRRRAGRIDVVAGDEAHTVDRLVVCGGLESDRLGQLVGGPAAPRIVPFRGEYLRVAPAKQEHVRGMVYPVPDPRYPFLGVHFTRLVDGGLEVGPNAFLALSRRRYGRGSVGARDVASTLGWPGFWRFAGRHWRTGIDELRGVLSTRSYLRVAQRYVPDIGPADVRRARLGLRAQAVERDGTLVDDFVIHHEDGITSVRNAPSPAATSSMAIAEHVVDRVW
ncbi:L-2-hydroxyglutarate oxidase [Nocardioides sp. MAH-18]|uniref:L-2-hydroxyglutarate oxidase n=1 Tax=Nocardioides agri TaxID=2682843 RepID=A0A6L6XUE5_9ACTN|nr:MULTISPECIES: L-2-hydroxyglutarate oxidase [unclassified Nocardioides]MBA2955808.1 L-2-hydroxyglutarate oxidase [Nocardioides sp. CGMCC 1.13656]MVQ50658.1 L-2-hydroxyglutarate oxidase [Nocardioides sp. MAH-18]